MKMTGGPCPGLFRADNDDYCPYKSQITYRVTAEGNTYMIEVAGKDNSRGYYILTITPHLP